MKINLLAFVLISNFCSNTKKQFCQNRKSSPSPSPGHLLAAFKEEGVVPKDGRRATDVPQVPGKLCHVPLFLQRPRHHIPRGRRHLLQHLLQPWVEVTVLRNPGVASSLACPSNKHYNKVKQTLNVFVYIELIVYIEHIKSTLSTLQAHKHQIILLPSFLSNLCSHLVHHKLVGEEPEL